MYCTVFNLVLAQYTKCISFIHYIYPLLIDDKLKARRIQLAVAVMLNDAWTPEYRRELWLISSGQAPILTWWVLWSRTKHGWPARPNDTGAKPRQEDCRTSEV